MNERPKQIILVHERGEDSVTISRYERPGRDPEFMVRIEPYNSLQAGYEEAAVRLDQRSIDRLRHWLNTGEVVLRGEEVPPATPGADA